MNKDTVSDIFNRDLEDTREKCGETPKTLGTVSVPANLASAIRDLEKLHLSALVNTNIPLLFVNDDNVLEKLEMTTLYVPKQQRPFSTNMQYLMELEYLEGQPGAKKVLKRRRKLPIFETSEEILDKISSNQVTVVYGEAGCGKTTQVPQYILDNAIRSREGSMCRIVCAVPTRMGAIRAAKQVADEKSVTVGHDSPVGYHIGNDNESARSNASITYCTSGVTLRLMLADPFLNEVSHLILDEVQERDMITDFLLRLIKNLIAKRPDLKVIVLSSTIYHQDFVNYFDNCAKVKVPAFLYPVEELYLEDVLLQTNFTFTPCNEEENLTRECSDLCLSPRLESYPKHVQQALNDPKADKLNFDLIVAVITDIDHCDRDGAILIFLPSVADIAILQRMLEQSFPDLIIPIHGAIINDFQMLRTQENKIYLATNVAESLLNLDDVAYVIDTGRVKTGLYDDGYTESSKFEWISRKNAEQRRRKAGRYGPGKCYHLFKKSVAADLKPYPAPEITRRNLEEVVLRMKMDSLGNAVEFLTKCLTPIPEEDIQKSVEKLQSMKMLDQNENLTLMGQTLVKLSMDPGKGKMIYLGTIFSCLDPVLTIAAQLMRTPMLSESPIRAERCTSDHVAFYQLIKQYEETEERKKPEFCNKYHVNKYQIAKVQHTKLELANKLLIIHRDLSYNSPKFNMNSENMNLVRAIVCAALYPNVAIIRNHNSSTLKNISVATPEGSLRRFHSHSVNAKRTNFPSALLVYNGIFFRNNIHYLCKSTLVSPLFLVLFSGNLSMHYDNSEIFINLSQDLRIRCDKKQTAKVLLGLREKLDFIIENEIYIFHQLDWSRDTETIRILRTVVDLIGCEDSGDRFPYVFKT